MLYEQVMINIPDCQPLMQNTDGLEFRIKRSEIPKFNEI
jgi:hypothetical protein